MPGDTSEYNVLPKGVSNIFNRILNAMPSLTKNQRLLAQFVIDHPKDVAFMTAAQLAKVVNVSESSVFRFATQIGYEGYPDFRSSIRDSVMETLTIEDRDQSYVSQDEDGEADIFTKALLLDAQTIIDEATNLNRADLYEAADMIIQAKSVYVVGGRSSSALAHYLCFYLSWLLPNVHEMKNDYALEKMTNLDSETLIIGITFNRCIQSVVNLLDLAARLGIPTMAITSNKANPLGRNASHVLAFPCNYISFIDSYTVPICYLNTLILAISRRKLGDRSKSFAELEALWKEHNVYVSDRKILPEREENTL